MTDSKLCTFEDCRKEHHARGYCIAHYTKLIRTGSPSGFGRTAKGTVLKFVNEVAVPCRDERCLMWPFTKNWAGHGGLTVNRKVVRAHRYVCLLVNGEPPTPKHEAAHSCGNGHLSCVNGSHLSWKTPKENAADKKLHGTHKFGQSHHIAKLKDDDIRKIRSLRGVLSNRLIGKKFGVSASLISMIMTGRKWSHVT